MPEPQTFSYRQHKRDYVTFALPFLLLAFIEGVLCLGLVLASIQSPVIEIGLLVALVTGASACLAMLLAPFFGSHQVGSADLDLHYGWGTRLTIPRRAIERLSLVRDQEPAGPARYDAARRELRLAFSSDGQVLLNLSEPVTARLPLGRDRSVERVLLSVDDPPGFLAALRGMTFDEPTATGERAASPQPIPETTPTPIRKVTFPTGPPTLEARVLLRSFGSRVAVDHLDLSIAPGEIYGFLGCNGAGKTTTLKMLVGLLAPTSGRATIAGYDVWSRNEEEVLAAKRSFGFVADRALLYERLTPREHLGFLAALRRLPGDAAKARGEELLTALDLATRADDACMGFSYGMKRKVALAMALLHDPAVLILDEPLNGLDPRSARNVRRRLLDSAAAGTAVLFSTHDLATAEALCHRIGILHAGRLVAEGSPDELRRLAAAPSLEEVFLSLTEEQEEVA